MSQRVDYGRGAHAYRQARSLPPEVLAPWATAVRSLGITSRRLLDVGAGPGGFLEPVAEWLGATTTVAVEPSAAMRGEAAAAGLTSRFPYVAAVAERLPLATASFDAAWISAAVHQFDDLEAAAGELRRVLGPGSQVLVRGFLADVAVTGVFSAFPGIERSAAAFPSTDVVTASFVAGGFEVELVVDVVEPWRFDVESWERLVSSVRATDSLLRRLTDEEVDAGVRSVIATTTADGTVQSDVTLRLVVFRAC